MTQELRSPCTDLLRTEPRIVESTLASGLGRPQQQDVSSMYIKLIMLSGLTRQGFITAVLFKWIEGICDWRWGRHLSRQAFPTRTRQW